MKKRTKIILVSLLLLLLMGSGGFYLYVEDYYEADATALAALDEEEVHLLSDELILIEQDEASSTALIFYPGAKVEYLAYLPILNQLSKDAGISIFITRMPFNMAIFDANRANSIIESYPDIEQWYIGGHSMGGAMASQYASKNQEKIEGLILLGAYLYGDYLASNSLTIYGTLNTSVADKIDYTENIVAIEGGNHAQFGNYGQQKGDAVATISQSEQQELAIDAIVDFIDKKR